MRSRFLLLTVLLASTLPATHAAETVKIEAALHVLNRLGYGPAPGDLEYVQRVGIESYILQQLHPERIALPETLRAKLDALETLPLDPLQLFIQYGPPLARRGVKPDPAAIKAARERARIIVRQAVETRLLRAIDSPRQLEEVMVDFWFNHFNVYAAKGLDHLWIGAYEREAIRPYVFGRFRDLLGATARHPAMLFYLDNWQNSAPGGRGKRRGLNENYARELLELHTLGVDGGYTQDDVIAAARVFTGWTLGGPRRGGRGGFHFDAARHDFGNKVFLGQTIEGAGRAEGEQVLDILARHPATARHISFKLAQYFVADDPPPALIDRLARRYQETDGDIRAVLATLFADPAFWDPHNRANKFKTPYQYLVSAVRAVGGSANDPRVLAGWLMQQGMPLYGCLTPNGYKNTEAAWLNPDAMTRRINLATALASGRLLQAPPQAAMVSHTVALQTDATAPVPLDEKVLARALGDHFSANTRATIDTAPQHLRAALILGSPEFMRR